MRTSTTARAPDRPDRAPHGGRPPAGADARRRRRQQRAGRWAPAGTAQLHPGVQAYTKGAQCTTNFVFADARRPRLPRVRRALRRQGRGHRHRRLQHQLAPARHPGPLRRGRRRSPAAAPPSGTAGSPTAPGSRCASTAPARHACAANDLALVRVDAEDAAQGQPERAVLGRPGRAVDQGRRAGHAGLLLRPVQPAPDDRCSPRRPAPRSVRPTAAGAGTSTPPRPGIPGDSGSGFLDADGRAVGTLSTVAIAPLAGSNGLGDLQRELRYAQRHSGIAGLRLVPGTEPFSPLL